MDPLSDVFRTLRVGSTLYFRATLGTPFGLEVGQRADVTRFHVVISGSCWATVENNPPVLLERGDLVLVPHGSAHQLKSSPDVQLKALQRALDETRYSGGPEMRYGGNGPEAVLVCGHFQIDDEASHPILERLPELIHVKASEGFDFAWLDAATRSISHEASAQKAGWEVVVDRVSEILFIQVLRAHRPDSGSAILAFNDEQLMLALRAIHDAPESDFTLQSLAKAAGMSRTSFAVRFRDLMGLTPMAYVTRWRLQRARASLLLNQRSIAALAEEAGYHSEAAFSRAFQRLYGSPPAAYRRTRELTFQT